LTSNPAHATHTHNEDIPLTTLEIGAITLTCDDGITPYL